MIILHNKNNLQSYIGTILCLFLFILPVFSTEYFTQKDLDEATRQAFALYNTNENDKALEIFEKIPKEYQNEQILLVMANIYEDNGNLNNAVTLLNQAIRVNPKFYKTYYNLGCLFLKNKEYQMAIENFKLSLKENREFAHTYYNLGCAYYALKDYNKAKKYFIRAVEIMPDEKNFYYNLGLTYKALGKEKQAKKILEKVE